MLEDYVPLNEEHTESSPEKNIRFGAGLSTRVFHANLSHPNLKVSMPISAEYYGNDQEEIRIKLGGSVGYKVNQSEVEFGNAFYIANRLGLSNENENSYSYGVVSSVSLLF